MLRSLVQRYRELPDVARWGVILLALIVGLNLLGFALDALYGGASPGPASSSYTTEGDGSAAYAELLRRNGREVAQLREEPSSAELDPAATLFVLAPDEIRDEDAEALRDFVTRGGRLVIGVDGDAPWLSGVVDGAPTWEENGVVRSEPLVPVAENSGVTVVSAEGTGAWGDAASTLPILGGDRITATAAEVGDGRILLLADPSMVHNQFVATTDNAAFALGLAGDRSRAVVFAETFHGYTEATGFAALPSRGKWTLFLLALVTLAAMIAFGRRFGPPDRLRRALPPPRRAYVDALADSLARMGDREAALDPLRRRARAALARRLSLPEDATNEQLHHAARARGSSEAETLLRPVRSERDVVAVGRAAVRVTRGID